MNKTTIVKFYWHLLSITAVVIRVISLLNKERKDGV